MGSLASANLVGYNQAQKEAPMSDDLTHIEIYTDGGADPNPGPGGWGVVLIHPQKTRELSGGDPHTTNNRMELTAAIEALKALTRPCRIDFYTDSQYVKNGITQWVQGWIAKGWKNVQNVDLWHELMRQVERHDIEWHWVKGHAGNHYNERADQLATEARPRLEVEIDPNITRVYLRISGKQTRGPYGWAAAVVRDEETEFLSGGHPDITSNHFSLWATIELLEQLPEDEPLQFFVNNSYLFDGITKWVNGWREGGWQRPPKFKEAWRTLDQLNRERSIRWIAFGKGDVPEPFEQLAELVEEARALAAE